MEILFATLIAASLAAAALGIAYWMLRKPPSQQRWHIFYTLYETEHDTFAPLYRVGCDRGTHSVPILMFGVSFEWECVSGAGYETRDDAIKVARELEDTHMRDLAALPNSDELADPDSTVFLPRMAQ